MSSLPPGNYYIRPKGTEPGGGLSTAPFICPPPLEVTVTTDDKINEYWKVVNSENGNFNAETTRSKLGPYKCKLFNKDNVLSATLFGKADDFRIKPDREARYTIEIPDQNLVLTYDAGAYPPAGLI